MTDQPKLNDGVEKPAGPGFFVRWLRRLVWTGLFSFLALILLIFFCDFWITRQGQPFCMDDITEIPHRQVGVVLGTSKMTRSGGTNLHYRFRLEAAIALFEAGKVDYLLVSGDNSDNHYDEPTNMKKDLVAKGIPAERIYRDYAGFRTLDSVVRAKKVFGQESFTVISQPFHNQRALFLAQARDINAIGFHARDVTGRAGFKTKLREKFARVKAVLDVTILGKEPKFLGPVIRIGVDPPT